MKFSRGFMKNKAINYCLSKQIVNVKNSHDVIINEKFLDLLHIPTINLNKNSSRNESDVSLNNYQNNIIKFTGFDKFGRKLSGSLVNNKFFNINILPTDILVRVHDVESKRIKIYGSEDIEYLVTKRQWNEINQNNEINNYEKMILDMLISCDNCENYIRLVKEFFNIALDASYSTLTKTNYLSNGYVILCYSRQ